MLYPPEGKVPDRVPTETMRQQVAADGALPLAAVCEEAADKHRVRRGGSSETVHPGIPPAPPKGPLGPRGALRFPGAGAGGPRLIQKELLQLCGKHALTVVMRCRGALCLMILTA